MSNDDSRGKESPDRSHVPNSNTRVRSDGGSPDDVRERLESIEQLTKSLLADVRNADETDDLEDVDEETRREAMRRLREVRAETMRVGLVLFGPDVTLPDGPSERSDRDVPMVTRRGSHVTSHLGPDPEAFERNADAHEADRDAENHNGGDRDDG